MSRLKCPMRIHWRRSRRSVVFGGLMSLCVFDFAYSADIGDGDYSSTATSTLPNIYLDLRTVYTTIPAGSLSIGFSPGSVSTLVSVLRTLSARTPAGMAQQDV